MMVNIFKEKGCYNNNQLQAELQPVSLASINFVYLTISEI